jgi:hypothetical protein
MKTFRIITTVFIALVWLVSGLYAKLLNQAPWHKMIVARILSVQYAGMITNTIGVLEILMSVWVLTRIKHRFCAITQMALVAVMNILEVTFARDLLLFGWGNVFFATVFIIIIFLNEYIPERSSL